MENANNSLFDDADLIHSYTRADALADGTLVELDPHAVREAGIRCSVAVSRAVFADCIALTPAATRAGQDIRGRTWDVLSMLALAMRSRHGRGTDQVTFLAYVSIKRVKPTPTTFKALIGPGDEGEAVITIVYPSED